MVTIIASTVASVLGGALIFLTKAYFKLDKQLTEKVKHLQIENLYLQEKLEKHEEIENEPIPNNLPDILDKL